MNLIPHANGNENREECRFFANMLKWLVGRKSIASFEHEVVRNIPDEVSISILSADGRTNVLFREAYFHNWQAYIQKDGVQTQEKIYKAGPDVMLVRIPAGMDSPFTVVFTYKKSVIEWSGILITAASLFVLAIYAVRHKRRRTYGYS